MQTFLFCYMYDQDGIAQLAEPPIEYLEDNQVDIQAKKDYYVEPLGYTQDFTPQPQITNTVMKFKAAFFQNQPDGSKTRKLTVDLSIEEDVSPEDFLANTEEIQPLLSIYPAPTYSLEKEKYELNTYDDGSTAENLNQSVVIY